MALGAQRPASIPPGPTNPFTIEHAHGSTTMSTTEIQTSQQELEDVHVWIDEERAAQIAAFKSSESYFDLKHLFFLQRPVRRKTFRQLLDEVDAHQYLQEDYGVYSAYWSMYDIFCAGLPPGLTPNDVEWHGRLFNRHEKDAVRRLATAIYFVNKWRRLRGQDDESESSVESARSEKSEQSEESSNASERPEKPESSTGSEKPEQPVSWEASEKPQSSTKSS